jgi:hypothetical protein
MGAIVGSSTTGISSTTGGSWGSSGFGSII